MSSSRILQLAKVIAEKTAIVDGYLSLHKLPSLTFDPDGPVKALIPANETYVVAAQDEVIASTQELHNLMKGPDEMLMGLSIINPNDVLSLQAVYHYKIATLFPIDGTATYEELSTATGLNEIDLRRLLRHAMMNHVFQDRDGKVAHTAASRILAENPTKRDIIGIMCEELFSGSARTVDALERWNGAKAPNESGYSLGHQTDQGLYGEISKYPERGTRFASAMSGFAERTGVDTLASGFDWAAVSTVVDVGGGWGEVSLDLAQRFGHIKFTVQDLKHVIEGRPECRSEDMKSRVEYVEHNFFEGQDMKDVDVYYFRYIFHNYPDETCVKLLQAQITALKPGAHILIQDAVIPEPRDALPAYKEKYRRSMDLVMLTFFGARERTLREWEDIIREADPKLKVKYEPKSDILDVMWEEHALNGSA